MKIYFKHRKTNFRKREEIHKFLFSLIKKKEEGLQVPGGGGWILPQWSGCASIRSTITTAARTTPGLGRRVARMGRESRDDAHGQGPEARPKCRSKFCYRSDNK